MNITDYLLPQENLDWTTLLTGFKAVLPREFTVWFCNRFGDVFMLYEDRSINMLDLGCGLIPKLASSKDEFNNLIDSTDNANDWLLVPLVDRGVAAGLTLGPGQCYSFKMLPVFGGSYEIDNVFVTEIRERYAFAADVFSQIKDLPDGSRIRIKVVD